jgi:hypothetical protein
VTAPVFVDYADRGAIAGLRLGGMSIVERIVRDAAVAGAPAATVRLAAADRPSLPSLPIAVTWLPVDAPPPPTRSRCRAT